MEEEILFENRIYLTTVIVTEYYRKAAPMTSKLLDAAAIGLVVAMNLFMLWEHNFAWPMLLIISIFAIGFIQSKWKRVAEKNIQQRRKLNGGKDPEQIVRFGDEITSEFGNVRNAFQYSQIEKTIRMKHSYALMVDDRMGILITEDGFAKGDMESFRAFLRKKCPNVEIV